MEWIIIVVLVILLLVSLGPRGGYYGSASILIDIISLVIAIAIVVFILDFLGIIEVFGVGA